MLSRIRSLLVWLRRRPLRSMLIICLIGFVALNWIAYQHSRAMLWFVQGGSRTPRPQKLSILGKAGVLLTGVRVPRPENGRTPSDLGLQYETKLISVDPTVTLEAWAIPVARPRGTVILFHGYAAAKCELLPEAEAFHELGYDVWLVDFRGSGGSSERYTTIGVREADDVAAAVDYVREKSPDGPLVLYGRSMGAAAVLRGIHACGVVSDAVILESVFDRMSTTAANRFHLMGLPAFPGANLLIFWGGVSAGFDGSRHNPVDYAPSCRCPVVMLHGELDPNARLEEGHNVRESLGDRSSALIVFPGTAHVPTLAADPQRWKAAIQTFLERVGH